ncbi:alpha-fetoprotein-like [Alligator sinensis]|uniref:Alpha-fetoprotein-like n=2 Tax=Alligator sinensis TaxID=38654 RepID=A0A1U8D5Q7_ALLSI|nr:alpha-fetoprotein-like [Alligator sinensis]
MKWGTLISFLFVVSLTIAKALPRSYRDVGEKNIIRERFAELGEQNFRAISMVMFAQYVQKVSFEKAAKMVDDVTDLAKRCVADAKDPKCAEPLTTLFLAEICQEEGLTGITECCAKDDSERNECFLSHKNVTKGFIHPFKNPEPEKACSDYADNQNSLVGYFIYEISRRHPFLYAPTILFTAYNYEKMMNNCCSTKNNPNFNLTECFVKQQPVVIKPVKEDGSMQEHTCEILKKFGERTLKALTLALFSQKFPKADFDTMMKMTTDIVEMQKECCQGDMLDCMHNRAEFTSYACSHQDAISSKIQNCCEKPVLERSKCIFMSENDDKPTGLSPQVRQFIEDQDVCKHFEEKKDIYLAEFLYEYSRRHTEFSLQMLLRIGKGYHGLLEKCCKTSSPQECYGTGEEELRKHIQESIALLNTNCEQYKKLGDYAFQNELLLRYTKRMPQLPSKELIQYTKEMVVVASRCCRLSDDKQMLCSEGFLDLVLGGICRRHGTDPINQNVCHCCDDSYALRAPCITSLDVDEKYIPIPLTPSLFTFDEGLCTTEENKLQEKKQNLLINLIKYKPHITKEQLDSITTAFTTFREKCCKVDNHNACFAEEGPNLITQGKAILGE